MPWVVSTAKTIWYQADGSLKTWFVVKTLESYQLKANVSSLLKRNSTHWLLSVALCWENIVCLVASLALLIQQLKFHVLLLPALLNVCANFALLA